MISLTLSNYWIDPFAGLKGARGHHCETTSSFQRWRGAL